MGIDFYDELEEEQKKKEEEENEANTDGMGDSEAPREEERASEPVSATGETPDIDGTPESEPELAGEVIPENERDNTSLLDSSSIRVFSDDSNAALGVELGSEDDIDAAYEGMVKTLDLSWRYLKNNSLFTKVSELFGRWQTSDTGDPDSDFNAELMYSPEARDFDKEAAFKRDGIPLEDQELYSWVKTPRQYEYAKQVIADIREDEELLSNGDEATEILSFPGKVADFALAAPMFKGVDAALGGLWKASNLADKVVRLANWRKFFSFLKPGYIEDLFKAAGTGTVFGTIDYASKNDVSGEEAFYYGLTLSLIDGGFRATGRAISDKLKKKMAEEISGDISAQDHKQLAVSRMEEAWNESLAGANVNKLTETLATKGLTATHPYQMVFVKDPKVSRMATRLFTFNDEFIEQAKWIDASGGVIREAPAELTTNFYNTKDLNDFLKITDRLDKIYKDVKSYERITPREYLWQSVYTGGEHLPGNLPHRSEIIDMAKNMRKKMADMHDLEVEVRGRAPEMEESFLPFEETGANFSIEKIVARQKAGIKGSKPGYLPRSYSREAIEKNQVEFKELLKQGLINTKAVELGDELTEEALRAYADSPELTKAVETQFEDVLNSLAGIGKKSKGRIADLRRIIRVDDRALYKFFRRDSIEEMFNYLRRQRGILEFEKAYKSQGYETWEAFIKDVDKDYNAAKQGLVGEAREAIDKEQKKVRDLLEQAQYVMLYRHMPLHEATALFKTNPAAIKAIEGARNLLMSAWLGRTVFSSLSDVKGMMARYGIANTTTALMRTVGGTFNRAFREIAHLPKSEIEQIIDALVTGIEENRLHASLKFVPIQNDDVFFGASRNAKRSWTRTIADISFILSGQRAFDNGLRRTGLRLVLKDMLKHPTRRKEIAQMIKNRSFSEDVQKEIYQKLNRLVTKPTLADTPKWAYGAAGRFFNILQSWTFANTTNYVYPLINGKFSTWFATESILSAVALNMLSVYSKEWLKGGQFDLDKEEEQGRFLNAVFDQGLSDFVGSASIYWDGVKSLLRNGTERAFGGMSPLLAYGNEVYALLSNIFETLVGLGNPPSYYAARKGLHAVPGNTLPGVELLTVAAAEAWSGKSKDSTKRRRRR